MDATIPARRFDAFLIEDEARTLRAAAYVRFVFVALLIGLEAMPYLFQPMSLPRDGYAFLIKAGFLPVGFVQLWLSRSGAYRPWMKYVLLAADVAWLAFYQIFPNPWEVAPGGAAFVAEAVRVYDNQSLKWLWLFYVWVSFSFSAHYVRAFGLYVILAWLAQLLWLIGLPGTTDLFTVSAALGHASTDRLAAQPGFVDIGTAVENILATIFLTLGFVFVAGNNHRLVSRFFASEERRGALSRYFSPNLVERLADRSTPDRTLTRAAVLFTDIKGFTTFAHTRPPEEILGLLQRFHGLIEAEVFAREGTLEKYIGDAVMAVFGAPVARDDDADRALACALAWLDRVEAWNITRAREGASPIAIGVGLDYGEVVSGVIGEDRNMSFAVVGAAVNVASRLEGLTRDFDADLVLSDRFHAALENPGVLDSQRFVLRQERVAVRNMPEQDVWLVQRKS